MGRIKVIGGMSREDVEGMGAMHPLGRIGQPRDISAMVLFLLSERAAAITGQIITVDAGTTA